MKNMKMSFGRSYYPQMCEKMQYMTDRWTNKLTRTRNIKRQMRSFCVKMLPVKHMKLDPHRDKDLFLVAIALHSVLIMLSYLVRTAVHSILFKIFLNFVQQHPFYIVTHNSERDIISVGWQLHQKWTYLKYWNINILDIIGNLKRFCFSHTAVSAYLQSKFT